MVWGVNIFWSNYFSRCVLADMSRYVQAAVLQLFVVDVFLRDCLFGRCRNTDQGLNLTWNGLIHGLIDLTFSNRQSLTYLRFHTQKQPSTILIDAFIILFSETDAVQIFNRISSFTQSSKNQAATNFLIILRTNLTESCCCF